LHGVSVEATQALQKNLPVHLPSTATNILSPEATVAFSNHSIALLCLYSIILFDTEDSCSSNSNLGMTTVVLDTAVADDAQRVVVEHYLKRKINCIRSFRIVGNLFSSDGYRKPVSNGLRSLLECIKEMTSLEEVDLCGDMHFENPRDIQILCDAFRDHPSLRSIKLRNFLVYTRRDPGSVPLLDPLVESIQSIPHLKEFHVACGAVFWDRKQSLLSTESIQSLCQSMPLQALTLSGLKLTDKHFQCLAEHISPQSPLTEVVLNRNDNTNDGIRVVAESLLCNQSKITRLETYNGTRANKSTSDFLRKQLYANHTIQSFRVNVRFEYRAEMDFILLLNLSGRKTILEPQASMQEVLSTFRAAAANNNVSGLLYFLQSHPGILQNRRNEMRELADETKKQPASPTSVGWHFSSESSDSPTNSSNGLGSYLKTTLLPTSGWWKVAT
jgi:hypothetical protein